MFAAWAGPDVVNSAVDERMADIEAKLRDAIAGWKCPCAVREAIVLLMRDRDAAAAATEY